MTARLITEGRVVRCRHPEPGGRAPKALWVIHDAACVYAPGCDPLADLVARFGEAGVVHRVRLGRIARCVTCRPTIVESRPAGR